MVQIVILEAGKGGQRLEIVKGDAAILKGQKPFFAQLAQNAVHVNRT